MFYVSATLLYTALFYMFYIIYSWPRRYTGDVKLVEVKQEKT